MEYIKRLKLIIQNLEKCPRVVKYSTKDENQADTLANAFIDIEDAITEIKEQIQKLYIENITMDEVDDVILEIGEELRHILYHVSDTRVYDYLKEQ